MSDERFAPSPEASAPPAMEHDYDSILSAMMATARGRWFLEEYARRSRSVDVKLLLQAVSRLESHMIDRHSDVDADLFDDSEPLVAAPAAVAATATPRAEPEPELPADYEVKPVLQEWTAETTVAAPAPTQEATPPVAVVEVEPPIEAEPPAPPSAAAEPPPTVHAVTETSAPTFAAAEPPPPVAAEPPASIPVTAETPSPAAAGSPAPTLAPAEPPPLAASEVPAPTPAAAEPPPPPVAAEPPAAIPTNAETPPPAAAGSPAPTQAPTESSDEGSAPAGLIEIEYAHLSPEDPAKPLVPVEYAAEAPWEPGRMTGPSRDLIGQLDLLADVPVPVPEVALPPAPESVAPEPPVVEQSMPSEQTIAAAAEVDDPLAPLMAMSRAERIALFS